MKLYVGNLPFQATDSDVREFFARGGITLDNVTLMRDRVSGEPRGFGFVEIADRGGAERAIETCSGKDFMGRAIVVNEARQR
jgi:RNA recognition motif-containing protein